jgi:hypothetical protein
MTVLSAADVAGYWLGAGGPKSRIVEWVAIAIGESGFDTEARSPAGALGVWQIMPFNAAPYGFTVGQLTDPAVNARIAVEMSGGGANCAAWDSCYRDIAASGRYTFLAWPEEGSPNWGNLATAAAELGSHVIIPTAVSQTPGLTATLAGTVTEIQHQGAKLLPAQSRRVQAAAARLGRMYR